MALPASEQKWADENGGVVGEEGPDANGITTYHTANGSYVNIRANGTPAMRGRALPPDGTAQPATAAPSAAPRGSGMTQQELEALIAKLGPLGAGDFREETKEETVPNPQYDKTETEGIKAQPTIKQATTYRTWTKPGTNIRLTVKVNPDQTYTKTYDGPDDAIKPAAGTTPADKNAAELQRQREKNAALPKDQDPAYETDEDRRTRAQTTIKQQGADAAAADARTRQTRLDEEAAARNKEASARGNASTSIAQSEEARKAEEARRKASESTTPDPQGGPQPSFQIGDAAKDLAAYDTWLAGQIGTGPGKITVARADQLREQRRKTWEVAISAQQGIVNTQAGEAARQTNERGQTLQDQGNRRSSATQIANQASGDFMPLATKLGAGGGAADLMRAISDARINAQDFVTMSGANRMVPPTAPGPALASVNGMALNPRAGQPNALGLGQGGTIFRPQPVAPPPAPAAASAAPTVPQGASRTADPAQGGGPAFRPAPTATAVPVPSPADAAAAASPTVITARNNRTGETRKMTPVEFNGLPDIADWTAIDPNAGADVFTPQQGNPQQAAGMPAAPATNMKPDSAPTAEPGMPPGSGILPYQPPVPIPYPDNAGAQSQMMPTAAPNFMSGMRPGSQPAYDPTPAAHALIADPSWDNAAVQEAYRQLYGRDMPMPQVA